MQHNARTIIQNALATKPTGADSCAMDAENAPGVFRIALDGIRAAKRIALAAPATFRLRALLRDCALDGSLDCAVDLFTVPTLDATGIVHPADPTSFLAKQLQDHYQRYHHGKAVKNCKYAEKVAKTAKEVGLSAGTVLANADNRTVRHEKEKELDGTSGSALWADFGTSPECKEFQKAEIRAWETICRAGYNEMTKLEGEGAAEERCAEARKKHEAEYEEFSKVRDALRLDFCRKMIPEGEATSLCEIAKMAEEEIKNNDPNPVAKEWIEKAPETIEDGKAKAVAETIRESVKRTEAMFNHGLEEMAGPEEAEAAVKKAEAENAVNKAEKAYDRAKESFRKVIENGLAKGEFTHNEKGELVPSSQKALDRYNRAKQKADDALTALNAAKDALANPPKPAEEPKPTEGAKPTDADAPAPEQPTRLTMEEQKPTPPPFLPDTLADYEPPPGTKLGAEEKAQTADLQAQYKAAMASGDTAKAVEARDRYRQLCSDLDDAAEQMGCGRTLPKYAPPPGGLLSQHMRETLQGFHDQFDTCVTYGDYDQACHVRDQYNAYCGKLNAMFDGQQKDANHAERGALSAMWDAIGDALAKTIDSTLGRMFGRRFEKNDAAVNSEKSAEERGWKASEARTRALIDSLIKSGQIKSSSSGSGGGSGGGDTIGLDRLTAGSFTGPDTPPPTSIYPEVPPDQRDTSFMDAKKKVLSDLFKENGVKVSFDRSLNGPSSVSYDIRWKNADDWATIQKVLKNDSAIGSRVSFELHPNSEPNTARLHITNPKPRDAGVRRLLEASDMKAVSRMGVPFLAGEAEDGTPIWVDLKEHGFVGGDSGSGKTARILAGVAGLLHAKSPEEIQLIVNAHANPGDYDPLSDDPHCIRIGDSYDAVAENLRAANAEWKRRKELFANAHVKDIGAYNALMKSQGHPEKCLPFQLSITDEVTNLLAERPELAKEIQGIVTNGRKYGVVHLGATQDMGSQNLKGMTDMKGAVRIGVQSTNPTASDKIFGERVQGLRDIAKKGDCIVKDGSGKIRRLRGAYASDAHWKALRDYDASAYHRAAA